jgi:methyl-accepting chemotaxis protein
MKFLSALAGPLARLGFGQRLALAFAVVLTLTAALGGASVFNLSRVHRSSFDLSDKWLPSVGSLAAARVAILEVCELEMKHSRAADASYHAEYEDKLKEAQAKVSASLADHGKIAHDADGAKLAAVFAAKWQEYLGFHQKVINFGRPRRATTHAT